MENKYYSNVNTYRSIIDYLRKLGIHISKASVRNYLKNHLSKIYPIQYHINSSQELVFPLEISKLVVDHFIEKYEKRKLKISYFQYYKNLKDILGHVNFFEDEEIWKNRVFTLLEQQTKEINDKLYLQRAKRNEQNNNI